MQELLEYDIMDRNKIIVLKMIPCIASKLFVDIQSTMLTDAQMARDDHLVQVTEYQELVPNSGEKWISY